MLFAVALLVTAFSFAQVSKFSLEASYPFAIGDNFMGKDYDGIAEIGGKYNFLSKATYTLGASFNTGVLRREYSNNSFEETDFNVTAITLQPRFVSQFNISKAPKLHPMAALGYSYIVFMSTGTVNGEDVSGLESTQSGVNLNFAIAYDVTAKIFVQLQYDYIKLIEIDGAPKTGYNTNVSMIKMGLGWRL